MTVETGHEYMSTNNNHDVEVRLKFISEDSFGSLQVTKSRNL